MVKFASFPPPKYASGNPFMELYYKELRLKGWELVMFNFNIPNLIKNAGRVDVCYFHWPQSGWRKGSLTTSFIKSLYFRFNCIVAKWLGYKLIWSAHNALPHEYKSYKLEKWMRKFLVNKFDLIVGHSQNTYQDLQKIVGFDFKDKYVLVEHGTYENEYQPAQLITRETLNIANDKKVILLKCSKKDYQGSNEAVKFLLTNKLPDNLHFLLIGDAGDQKVLLDNHKNITVLNRKVSDAELADIFVLSNVVWMPYKKITTSGFYFLALTFNKLVLATDLDFFRLHSDEGMIYLYSSSNLALVIKELSSDDKKFDNAELLQRFNWKNNVGALVNAYGSK